VLGAAGIANGSLNVLFFTVTQQLTLRHPASAGHVGADALQSRGLSAFRRPEGLVTTHFGPTLIFVATGALMALASLFGWLQPEMRKLS